VNEGYKKTELISKYKNNEDEVLNIIEETLKNFNN